MTLTLDHVQRLNLHALLGAQRGDVATVRAFWALQDNLGLTPEEEKAIELRRDFSGGHERVLWNPSLSIPAKAFDFTEAETARIRAAVEAWSGYAVAADRRWLEPLLHAISLPEKR